jgi:hypothetical protein
MAAEEALSISSFFIFFPGNIRAGGTNTPEAFIQQTIVKLLNVVLVLHW